MSDKNNTINRIRKAGNNKNKDISPNTRIKSKSTNKVNSNKVSTSVKNNNIKTNNTLKTSTTQKKNTTNKNVANSKKNNANIKTTTSPIRNTSKKKTTTPKTRVEKNKNILKDSNIKNKTNVIPAKTTPKRKPTSQVKVKNIESDKTTKTTYQTPKSSKKVVEKQEVIKERTKKEFVEPIIEVQEPKIKNTEIEKEELHDITKPITKIEKEVINELNNKADEYVSEISKKDEDKKKAKEEKKKAKKEKKNNNKKVLNKISFGTFTIYTIIAIVFVIFLMKFNMLPTNIVVLISVCLGALSCLFGFFALSKKKALNIIEMLLSVILSICFGLGALFVHKTDNSLSEFFNEEKLQTKYFVITKNDFKYQNFDEVKDTSIGILRENSKNMKEYIESKGLHINIYDAIGDINISLGKDNKVIILSDSLYESLNDIDPDFLNTIKIIDNFLLDVGEDIESDIKEILTEEELQRQEEMRVRKEKLANLKRGNSFILYLTGIDGGGYIRNTGLSDVNMLAVVNPDKNKILLISIPRDYYVSVNGKKDKLTHAGLYGTNTSVKTIENLFGLKVDYYAKVCFGAVEALVDDIGGITVYSDTEFDSYHLPGWHVNKGNVYMDGKKALAYSRERYAYSSGDRHRVKNQQDVISAAIKKVATNQTYLLNFNSILNDMNPYFQTSMSYSKIQSLVKSQISSLKGWSISQYTLNGSNGYYTTASFPGGKTYVMLPNYNTVYTAQDKIIATIEG